MKRILSFVLVMAMLVSVIPMFEISASAAESNWLWPIESSKTLSRGYYLRNENNYVGLSIDSREPTTGSDYHEGIDISAPNNTPVKAAKSGTVVIVYYGCKCKKQWKAVMHEECSSKCDKFYPDTGITECGVSIAFNLTYGCNNGFGVGVVISHGNGEYSSYAHLSEYNCKVGDEVKQGAIIGYTGETGITQGDHLHFSIHEKATYNEDINYIKGFVNNNPKGLYDGTYKSTGSWNGIEGISYIDNINETHTCNKPVCSTCGAWTLGDNGSETSITPTVYTYKQGGKPTHSGPYGDCGNVGTTVKNADITVVATIINSYGRTWYKIENGQYVFGDYVKKKSNPTLKKSGALFTSDFSGVIQGQSKSFNGIVENCKAARVVITNVATGKVMLDNSFNGNNAKREITINTANLSLPGDAKITVTLTDLNGNVTTPVNKTFYVTPSVAVPSFNGSEDIDGGKRVKLYCSTAGATIYYTTNGTTPTTSSAVYPSSGITLTQSATVKAIAVYLGKKSEVFGKYISVEQINADSNLQFSTEETPDGTRVLISSGLNGASIYYSLNANLNGGNFVRYTQPLVLTSSATVSAYVTKRGYINSRIKSLPVSVTPPSTPVISSPSDNIKLAQNSAVKIQWNSQKKAAYYSVNIYKDNTLVETKSNIKTTNYSFILSEAGTYSYTVQAHGNAIGSSDVTPRRYVQSMTPLKVRFLDWKSGDEYTEMETQTVPYGSSATEPAEPSKRGYNFLYWDKSFDCVTTDLDVKAKYKIITYSVRFYDDAGRLLKNEKINYGGSVTPPDEMVEVEAGYTVLDWTISATEFDSKYSFDFIDSNMNCYAVVGWAVSDLPAYIKTLKATRTTDGTNVYTVNTTLNSIPSGHTTAMLRISLKTSEGKLVQTALQTVSLPAGSTNVTATSTLYSSSIATKAEAVVLGFDGEYKTSAVQSRTKTANVEVISSYDWSSWSSWSTTPVSSSSTRMVETKTQYSKRTKSYVTGSLPSMNGWTLESTSYSWVPVGNGYTDYVDSWPSTYYKNSSLYNKYSKIPSNYESGNSKRVYSSSSSNIGYIYWHWCRNGSNGPTNRTVETTYTNTYSTFHEFFSTNSYTYKTFTGYDAAYQVSQSEICRDSYYWAANRVDVKRKTYTDYQKNYSYTFSSWSGWSDWTDSYIAASSTVNVQTRTLYRYRDKNVPVYNTLTGNENNEGQLYRFQGNIATNTVDLTNKYATVMAYKGKNTDPNESQLQYIGEIQLHEGNSYDISFKTKDVPSINTGDYIVCLSIQGTTGLINIGIIEAPKPDYKVTYYDEDGSVISTQTVKEGENAAAPQSPTKDGKRFVTWSDSGTDIYGDTAIYAIYTPKTYAVVFVDWVNETVEPYALEYGTDIRSVADLTPATVPGYTFLGWDAVLDDNTEVTDNMVINAVYDVKEYNVNFVLKTADGETVISSQVVPYGECAEVPSFPETEGIEFLGWSTSYNWWNVTENMTVYALISYGECSTDPIPSVSEFVVCNTETIEFTADENAEIYYTLDGSEPEPGVNAIKYNSPIVLTESAVVKAVALEPKKDISEIVTVEFVYSEEYSTFDEHEFFDINTIIIDNENDKSPEISVSLEGEKETDFCEFFIEYDMSSFYYECDENGKPVINTYGAFSSGDIDVVEDSAGRGIYVIWQSETPATVKGELFSIPLKYSEEIENGSHYIYIGAYVAGDDVESVYSIKDRANPTALESGAIGDNITWLLNSNGQLIVSGEGEITGYNSAAESPFYPLADSIKEIIIEEGITSIGSYTFSGLSNAESISLPDTLQSIGYRSFSMSSSVKTLIIPDSVVFLNDECFNGCGCESLVIGKNLNTIYGFAVCGNLSNVVIKDGVSTVGSRAFWACSNLSTVVIPYSVTKIGSQAFGATAIKNLVVPSSITEIGDNAFLAVPIEIVIPDSVKTMGKSAVSHKNAKIYCSYNSTAYNFAVENGVNYELVGLFETRNSVVDYSNGLIFSAEDSISNLYDVVLTDNTVSGVTAIADNLYYGTGSEITATDGSGNEFVYNLIVNGDLDGDGVCDALDVCAAERMSSGNEEASCEQIYAANGCISDELDVMSYQNVVNAALA